MIKRILYLTVIFIIALANYSGIKSISVIKENKTDNIRFVDDLSQKDLLKLNSIFDSSVHEQYPEHDYTHEEGYIKIKIDFQDQSQVLYYLFSYNDDSKQDYIKNTTQNKSWKILKSESKILHDLFKLNGNKNWLKIKTNTRLTNLKVLVF